MKHISENTSITVSLVLVIIGGVMWLTTLYATTEANSKAIQHIGNTSDAFQKEVIHRLSRLEAMLENKRKYRE